MESRPASICFPSRSGNYFRPYDSRIDIACARWGNTGSLLLARAHMGLSRQLPVLQLRPMHGDRERYGCLLRDQPPIRVCAPAERCPSPPILSLQGAQPWLAADASRLCRRSEE